MTRPSQPSDVRRGGYRLVYEPGHARAGSNGYVYEHIIVAERALGKPLPRSAEIHHVNETRSDNAPGNLVICPDRAYHFLLHQRQRALDACGDAAARKCQFCRSYDRQSDLRIVERRGRGRNAGSSAYHPDCKGRARRERSVW